MKNKVTDEDVINEFREINNSSKGGFIFVIVILVIALGGCIYLLIKNDRQNVVVNEEENNTSIIINEVTKVEQMIFTDLGDVVIDDARDAYYILRTEEVIEGLDSIGTLGDYSLSTYGAMTCTELVCNYDRYLLDVDNITGAYEIKFNLKDTSIVLIDDTGKVHELLFENNDNAYKIELHHDVFNDVVIVSAKVSDKMDSKYLILVDEEGNEYEYYGVVSMRQ